jgi:hypothetical protein
VYCALEVWWVALNYSSPTGPTRRISTRNTNGVSRSVSKPYVNLTIVVALTTTGLHGGYRSNWSVRYHQFKPIDHSAAHARACAVEHVGDHLRALSAATAAAAVAVEALENDGCRPRSTVLRSRHGYRHLPEYPCAVLIVVQCHWYIGAMREQGN